MRDPAVQRDGHALQEHHVPAGQVLPAAQPVTVIYLYMFIYLDIGRSASNYPPRPEHHAAILDAPGAPGAAT